MNDDSFPHHVWGDETFDWKGLHEAGDIISETCRRWGRLGVHTKEKWGTLRASTWFWDGSLHQLLYPGYVYCQYKGRWRGLGDRLWWCDVYLWPKLAEATGALKVVHWWQRRVYNYAYQQALIKYPKLKNEILVDADHISYIKGGPEVHDRFWVTHKKEES